VAGWMWRVLDERGEELRASDVFEDRAGAEEWLAEEWRALAGEGGHEVVLVDGDRDVYTMGLGAP
jgi:hypothetical protein